MGTLKQRSFRTACTQSVARWMGLPLAAALAFASPACGGPVNAPRDGGTAVANEGRLPPTRKLRSSREVADCVRKEIQRIVDLYKSHQGKPGQAYWSPIPENRIPAASALLDLNGFIRLGAEGNTTVSDAEGIADGILDLAQQMEKHDPVLIAKAVELLKRYVLSPRPIDFLIDFMAENSAEAAARVLEFYKDKREVLDSFPNALVAYTQHGMAGLEYLVVLSQRYKIPLEDLLQVEWNTHVNQQTNEPGPQEHVYLKMAERLIRRHRLDNAEARKLLFVLDERYVNDRMELFDEHTLITSVKIAALGYGYSDFENVHFLVGEGYAAKAREAAELSRATRMGLYDVLELTQQHGAYATRAIATVVQNHGAELEEKIRQDAAGYGGRVKTGKEAVLHAAARLISDNGPMAVLAVSTVAKREGKKLKEFYRTLRGRQIARDAMKTGVPVLRPSYQREGQEIDWARFERLMDSYEQTIQRMMSEEDAVRDVFGTEERRETTWSERISGWLGIGTRKEAKSPDAGKEESSAERNPREYLIALIHDYGIEATEIALYLEQQEQQKMGNGAQLIISGGSNYLDQALAYSEDYSTESVIRVLGMIDLPLIGKSGFDYDRLYGTLEIFEMGGEDLYWKAQRVANRFRDSVHWRSESAGGDMIRGASDFYDTYWVARAMIELGEDCVQAFLKREGANIPDGERLYARMKE